MPLTATHLRRLWQQDEYEVVVARSCVNWFTEGFDTADLQEAKVLLDGLT